MTIRALLLSSSLVLSGSVWAQDREDNTPQDRLVVPRLQPQIQPRLQTPIRRPVNADRLAGLRKYLDNPAVLNMRIKYSEGRWSAEADKILPCNGPSKPASRSRQRVVVQLLNEDQKPVMRRVITNPRIILDEHHRGTELLDEMEFTLSMPYVEGAAYFVLTELNADEKSRNRAGQIVARERVSIQENCELSKSYVELYQKYEDGKRVVNARSVMLGWKLKPSECVLEYQSDEE